MIGFIILNYNTWEMTIKCVNSIFETCREKYKIYIVDNGSKNNSYEHLLSQYKDDERMVLIKSENYGYARGNNIGIKHAIDDGFEIITVVNNDVIFSENSISEMYTFLEKNPSVAVAAPYILSPEGELQNLPTVKPVKTLDYFLYNTKLNKFVSASKYQEYHDEYYLNPKNIKDEPIPIYKFSGCCFMARSKMMEKIGLFDENTFLYYEEDILSQKMYQMEYESYYLPQSKIVHHHGVTTGKDNLFVDTEMLKSEMYFLSKVYGLPFMGLLFIYLDRALTPIMKKMKKHYSLSLTEYKGFLHSTWKHFMNNAK